MSSSTWDRYVRADHPLPEKTWVWQLTGAGFDELRLVEIPRPKPGPKDIAFRVDTNSLCFSDCKVITLGEKHARLVNYDMKGQKVVLGHEISITVVERGTDADPKFKIGGRYIVQADMFKYNHAVGYDIWGGLIQYGVFSPQVQEYLIPVAKAIGYSEASLVEPWACVEASYQRADISDQDKVVWLCGGGGPMGQMHLIRVLSLKKYGRCKAVQTLLVTDISNDRLAGIRQKYSGDAEKCGIRLVCLNPTAPDHADALAKAVPEGVDYLVALAPIPPVIEAARKSLNRYGVLNLFAGLKRGTGPVTMGDIHYDQHTVTGNTGSQIEHMVRVLQMTERGELNTDASAGAVAGFKAVKEGLQAVSSGASENKIVIYPQLLDLPMTPTEKVAALTPKAPAAAKEKLAAGLWSREAEKAMIEALWRPA